MKLEFSQQIFDKYSNAKFHENPSIGSRVVPCGKTDGRTDVQTDMTKLIVAFRNFGSKNITQNRFHFTNVDILQVTHGHEERQFQCNSHLSGEVSSRGTSTLWRDKCCVLLFPQSFWRCKTILTVADDPLRLVLCIKQCGTKPFVPTD
jgi:hypothetical protein